MIKATRLPSGVVKLLIPPGELPRLEESFAKAYALPSDAYIIEQTGRAARELKIRTVPRPVQGPIWLFKVANNAQGRKFIKIFRSLMNPCWDLKLRNRGPKRGRKKGIYHLAGKDARILSVYVFRRPSKPTGRSV